jgi:hypothetical protein
MAHSLEIREIIRPSLGFGYPVIDRHEYQPAALVDGVQVKVGITVYIMGVVLVRHHPHHYLTHTTALYACAVIISEHLVSREEHIDVQQGTPKLEKLCA